MTQPELRYLIERKEPTTTRAANFGLTRAVEFETRIRGWVSVAEFQAMFGTDENIVHSMIRDIETHDHWTTTIGTSDVLACEQEEHSMQHVMINAMRKSAGLPPLSGSESSRRGRDYEDIKPEAALFLMEMYDVAYSPDDVDAELELARFDQAGLTIHDLLKDQPEGESA